MSEENGYQAALEAVQDEVLKIIALDNPPDVQHVLDIIESICRHGVDIRTAHEKAWRPQESIDDEFASEAHVDDTDKPES